MINIKSITRNCGGDPALVAELAQLFLEECPHYLLSLDQAMSERSSEGVRLAAHRLRGALAMFDAQASLEAAAYLEDMSASKHFAVTAEAVAALKSELAQVEGEIRSLTSLDIKNDGGSQFEYCDLENRNTEHGIQAQARDLRQGIFQSDCKRLDNVVGLLAKRNEHVP